MQEPLKFPKKVHMYTTITLSIIKIKIQLFFDLTIIYNNNTYFLLFLYIDPEYNE